MKKHVSIEIVDAEEVDGIYTVRAEGVDESIEILKEDFESIAKPIDAMDFEHALAFARRTGCTVKSGSFRLNFAEEVLFIENLHTNSCSDIFHYIAKELWSVDS